MTMSAIDFAELYRLTVSDLHTIGVAVGFQPTDEGVTPAAILERVQALVEERDAARAEAKELRLTLAAEQGRAEGAPSEGWRRGRPPDYYGGLDVRWYREVTPLVHVVVAWTGTGWIWRHFGGAMWLPWHYRRDPEVPTARAAMIAADKATT